MILSICIGIAVFALIYGLSLFFYFLARIRWANSKYAIEVIAAAATFIISFGIKIAIMAAVIAPSTWEEGLSHVLRAFYTGFGGFAFEGLDDIYTEADGLFECLYIGSTLYSGLMFVSIVSAKASYEAYSVMRCILETDKKKNIYVFTALTEDTLTLAQSIAHEHDVNNFSYQRKLLRKEISECSRNIRVLKKQAAAAEKVEARNETERKNVNDVLRRLEEAKSLLRRLKDGYGDKVKELKKTYADVSGKYKIAFAGPTLQPFDRKDELCAKAMANGFLYWSYSDKANDSDRNKSIARRVHLDNKNFKGGKCPLRYAIFAFEIGEDKLPLEEENMAIVLEDAKRRIAKKDKLSVEYHILSKRQVNYAAYDKMTEMLSEIDGHNEEIGLRSEINVWNEANVAAQSLVLNRKEDGSDEPSTIGNFILNMKSPIVRSIGFGEIGQAICKELYVQCASFANNLDYKSDDFTIDAFDPNINDINGLFRFEHPYFACTDIPKDYERHYADIEKYLNNPTRDLWEEFSEKGIPAKSVMPYLHYAVRSMAQRQAIDSKKEEVRQTIKAQIGENCGDLDEMPIPTVCWNAVSAFETSFFEDVDFITGKERESQETARTVVETFNRIVDADIAKFVAKRKTVELDKKKIIDGQIKHLERLKIRFPDGQWHMNAPDIFVIATENDFSNIRIANALINDICAEGVPDEGEKKQLMIVNLRDSRNNVLLTRPKGEPYDDNLIVFDGITVVVVGNSDKLYSFGNTLKYDKTSRYNFFYEKISKVNDIRNVVNDVTANAQETYDAFGKFLKEAGKGKAEPDLSDGIANWVGYSKEIFNNENRIKQDLDNIISDVKKLEGITNKTDLLSECETIKATYFCDGELQNAEVLKAWKTLDLWKKESNRSAYTFKFSMQDKYEKHTGAANVYGRLAALEHQRWIRMHIAGGWQYSNVRNNTFKQHTCIIPMGPLEPCNVMYDLCNVVMAIKDSKEK